MILVDANILLYAEDALHPNNKKAKLWWDEQLSGNNSVCLCWQVINAFIRISTNHRVFKKPLILTQAIERVQSWLNQPCVCIIKPTQNHWSVYKDVLAAGQATANLVSDAYLAALALQYNCILFSTDADFARFPRLKWKNPLVIK